MKTQQSPLRLQALSDVGHKEYREYTVIGVVANEILRLKKGQSVAVESVTDGHGLYVDAVNLRQAIGKIGARFERKFITKVINKNMVITAAK